MHTRPEIERIFHCPPPLLYTGKTTLNPATLPRTQARHLALKLHRQKSYNRAIFPNNPSLLRRLSRQLERSRQHQLTYIVTQIRKKSFTF